MIADAPYEYEESPLPALVGVGAGMLGAALMLSALRLLEPTTGVTVSTYLARVGGLLVHEITGAVLGLLYAVSQKPVPVRGVIGVGVFYGLLIWVMGGVLGGLFLGGSVRAVLHSWPWLLSCLLFGLSLAGAAIMWKILQPGARGRLVLRD